jgi:hypothetical protein
MTEVQLSSGALVPGRPFTDPRHLALDTAVLEDVRGSLRARVAEAGEGGIWSGPASREHLLVLPSVAALRATQPAVAVGFFGQARANVDHAPIVELEHRILRRAAGFRGLLVYYNVRIAATHQWGNLVVFADHDAPAELARDDEHRLSVAATPQHYESLRLHRYELPDGALGHAPLRWVRTTYLDLSERPPWRGVRMPDVAARS